MLAAGSIVYTWTRFTFCFVGNTYTAFSSALVEQDADSWRTRGHVLTIAGHKNSNGLYIAFGQRTECAHALPNDQKYSKFVALSLSTISGVSRSVTDSPCISATAPESSESSINCCTPLVKVENGVNIMPLNMFGSGAMLVSASCQQYSACMSHDRPNTAGAKALIRMPCFAYGFSRDLTRLMTPAFVAA